MHGFGDFGYHMVISFDHTLYGKSAILPDGALVSLGGSLSYLQPLGIDTCN